MPHANTNLFLNRLFVYSLKSWSVFWVKVQTTTISHWQINTENMKKKKKKKQETEMLTSWALPFRPEIKSHTEKESSVRTISSYPKVFGRTLRKGKWGGGTKTKQETVENPLRGSAVNGMHFSIQVTHPCRTSKTGLKSLPYSHRLRLLWSHWGCLE